jgi:hypothetical protein
MTSEEIKAVIERLGAYCNSTYDVMLAFMGYGNSADYGCTEFKGVLVDLLKQADHDIHMELPKDVDGEAIHIGDILDGDRPFLPATVVGYHEEQGCMLPIVANDGEFGVNPYDVRHYAHASVESVLREYAEIVRYVRDDDVDSVVNECASRIRELMQDEN